MTDQAWTWPPMAVCHLLTEAFRALPDQPVFSPRKRIFIAARGQEFANVLTVVSLTAGYLEGRPRELTILLYWARRKASGVGASYEEYARELGLCGGAKSFRDIRMRAARIVAEGLTRDGILPAEVWPGMAAGDQARLLCRMDTVLGAEAGITSRQSKIA